MGGEQQRPRQHILLFPAACLFLLIMTGCGLWSDLSRHSSPESRTADEEKASLADAMAIRVKQQEKQLFAREAEISQLKAIIQTQRKKIRDLELQIEQMKAVDLESASGDLVNEIP